MIDIRLKYYLFGSQDSRDIDVLIEHPLATGTKSDVQLIRTLKNEFPEIELWDINIVKIENRIVIKSIPAKGSVDSVHNSLFYTYDLHDQKYEQPLFNPVERNIPLAVVRSMRNILTRFKDTLQNDYYRQNISKILKHEPWYKRIDLLSNLPFGQPFYEDFYEEYKFYKSIMFNTAQTMMLLEGKEIFTKMQIKERFPQLANIFDNYELPDPALVQAILSEFGQKLHAAPITYHEGKVLEWDGQKVNYVHELPVD